MLERYKRNMGMLTVTWSIDLALGVEAHVHVCCTTWLAIGKLTLGIGQLTLRKTRSSMLGRETSRG